MPIYYVLRYHRDAPMSLRVHEYTLGRYVTADDAGRVLDAIPEENADYLLIETRYGVA